MIQELICIQIIGAATAAAFAAEQYFETIRVFERKGGAGGTWFVNPDSSGLGPAKHRKPC